MIKRTEQIYNKTLDLIYLPQLLMMSSTSSGIKELVKKWVKEDDAINERFTILTKEFSQEQILKNDKVLDIGCGGGITSLKHQN